ncbi:MAG TPA: hypothetical protein VF185_00920 [Patescibacteria group bacterium]
MAELESRLNQGGSLNSLNNLEKGTSKLRIDPWKDEGRLRRRSMRRISRDGTKSRH